jgi:hypothetical protein
MPSPKIKSSEHDKKICINAKKEDGAKVDLNVERKCSRHHHKSCAALLHAGFVAARSQVISWWVCSTLRVSIAVLLSADFVVVVSQNDAAC